MPISQLYRSIAIQTALGDDKLILKRASIIEELGQLFRIEVELTSESPDISFDDIVGTDATIRLGLNNSGDRYFNGFVSRFVLTEAESDFGQYRMTLVPWLWFLTRTSNCRIFQNMTVPDIIKQVFSALGFSAFRLALSASYDPWEYCVQYRETDFNFVSRLMEHEGIYYFFEHDNGKHTLVLADSTTAHQPKVGTESLVFQVNAANSGGKDYIDEFVVEREVQSGVYVLNDFNFEKPKVSLKGQSDQSKMHAQAKFEMYDYPGEYEEAAQGKTASQIRIEELQARFEIARGQTNDRSMAVGTTFTLTDFPRDESNIKYLITSTSLHLVADAFASGSAVADPYSCSFTVLDASVQYRSPRLSPKPLIQGPQTAIVTGPSGEEIHTDQYGRIVVQFPWDRYGSADENSSCWVRVSQAAWAGKKWGAMYIPRVGQEVIVEFLEGDPDRPIVTGRVYNADSMPPYDLPAEKTKTTLKSSSSKGGSGFNEIRFEDKKGAEQIFIHAEFNQDVRVKNNSLEYVGVDRHLIVDGDQYEKASGDKHQEVTGEHNQKIGENLSFNVGQNIQEKAGMNIGTEAGTELHLKAGTNLILEAGTSISLKAGGGFIVIGPSGVTISGTPVLINSGGSALSGSAISPTAPKAAQPADDAQPGSTSDVTATPDTIKPTSYGPTAVTLQQAANDGTPFCEQCAQAAAAQDSSDAASSDGSDPAQAAGDAGGAGGDAGSAAGGDAGGAAAAAGDPDAGAAGGAASGGDGGAGGGAGGAGGAAAGGGGAGAGAGAGGAAGGSGGGAGAGAGAGGAAGGSGGGAGAGAGAAGGAAGGSGGGAGAGAGAAGGAGGAGGAGAAGAAAGGAAGAINYSDPPGDV